MWFVLVCLFGVVCWCGLWLCCCVVVVSFVVRLVCCFRVAVCVIVVLCFVCFVVCVFRYVVVGGVW